MGLEKSSRCSWHLRDSTLVVRNQAMLSNVADGIGMSASHLLSAVRVSDYLSEAARTSGKVEGKIHIPDWNNFKASRGLKSLLGNLDLRCWVRILKRAVR